MKIINNIADASIGVNYSINLTLNTSASDGLFLESGDDLRIVYNNVIELDRVNLTPFNTSTTEIFFRINTSIAPKTKDRTINLYYDNDLATTPPNNASKVFVYYQDFNALTTGGLVNRDLY